MYAVDRKLGQSILVVHGDERYTIGVGRLTPSVVRLGFQGPQSFRFLREDRLDDRIQLTCTGNLKGAEMHVSLEQIESMAMEIALRSHTSDTHADVQKLAVCIAELARNATKTARANSQTDPLLLG